MRAHRRRCFPAQCLRHQSSADKAARHQRRPPANAPARIPWRESFARQSRHRDWDQQQAARGLRNAVQPIPGKRRHGGLSGGGGELDEHEARKWIASQIDSDKGAIAIGEASIVYTTVHTMGDHVAVHRPSVNREILAKIVDVDLLESRLAKIAASPNEKGKHVHGLFQAGLNAPGW
jgi:hypothetical protein